MRDAVSCLTTGQKRHRMRTVHGLALAAITLLTVEMLAQKESKTSDSAPLVLTGAIPLENVHGRIDHFGFDPKNRLFVSALGNNTEEVIDLSAPTGRSYDHRNPCSTRRRVFA